MTASSDSMCGVTLKVGKLYLIAGNSQRINICNSYAKEYSQLTIVERRGFAGGYKKGCACQVSERKSFIKRMHMSNLSNWIKKTNFSRLFQITPEFMMQHHQEIGVCKWTFSDCETDFGACVPARGHHTPSGKPIKCHWRNSQPYTTCLSKAKSHKQLEQF